MDESPSGLMVDTDFSYDDEDDDYLLQYSQGSSGYFDGEFELSPSGGAEGNSFGGDSPVHQGGRVEVFELEDMVKSSMEELARVAEVVCCPVEVVGALLRHYRWDQERLILEWMEDKERVCARVGVPVPGTEAAPTPVAAQEDVECPICLCDHAYAESLRLSCGHRFGTDCLRHYLESEVASRGGQCIFTTCPALKEDASERAGVCKCDEVVPDSVFQAVVGADVYKTYSMFLVRSFVDDNPRVKWCPAPDCGCAIRADASDPAVRCRCGNVFCFACQRESHRPCGCGTVVTWLRKCEDDGENVQWLQANAKMCPGCGVYIEKNQGCNHMRCRKCNHEFCWSCMGAWSEHGSATGGYYQCNAPKPRQVVEAETRQAAALRRLDYYSFYYKRYFNHNKSMQYVRKQKVATEKRFLDMTLDPARDEEYYQRMKRLWDVLDRALGIVFECRLLLKWSYAYGFYLADSPQKELFQFLQKDLEIYCEHLSELTEAELEDMDATAIAQYSVTTHKFLTNFITGIEEGDLIDPDEDDAI